MERILLSSVVVFFLLFYFTVKQPPIQFPDVEAKPLPDGCFIYAAAYQSALNAKSVLGEKQYCSNMFAVKFAGAIKYHAGLIFYYDDGTWIYDCNVGTTIVSSKVMYNLVDILEQAYPEAIIEDCFYIHARTKYPGRERDENE